MDSHRAMEKGGSVEPQNVTLTQNVTWIHFALKMLHLMFLHKREIKCNGSIRNLTSNFYKPKNVTKPRNVTSK